MKQNQNIDINIRTLHLKTPQSPKANQKKSQKNIFVSEKDYKNGNIQQNRNKYSTRQESPANRSKVMHQRVDSIKQISFTKFPPLKKNEDSSESEIVFDRTVNIGRKYSEKQNQINNNIKDKPNIRKKVVQKKKALLTNNINSIITIKYKQYKEFLQTVNITNNIKIVNQKIQFNPYVAFIGKGNNSSLIKNIFRNRPWWTITQDKDQKGINFVWTQLRQTNVLNQFKSIKMQGQFDQLTYQVQDQQQAQQTHINGNQQLQNEMIKLQNKNKTFNRSQSVNQKQAIIIKSMKNMRRNTPKSKQKESISSKLIVPGNTKQIKETVQIQKEKNKKDLLVNPKNWINHQNLRKIFSQKDMKILKSISAVHEDGSIKNLSRNKMRYYQNSNHFSSHNHLQNNWHLSNKKALFYNVKAYYQAKKINPFQYIPVTFHVEDMGSKQYNKFLEYYNQKNQQILNQQKKPQSNLLKPRTKKRNIWLVKPGQNTNRGTGISVTESIQEINQIIQKDKVDSMGRPRTHILQEYIMPFLYNKRKFDIRTYICVTSVNGINKGYWFQQGYIRTACKEFNFKNLSNKMIHLTNDAVQKKCQQYGKYEPGNKISFADFQRYLDSQQPKLKFWSTVYPDMKKQATDAIKAVYTKMDPDKRQFSFQIFGLDFMIDQNFKVWLIQANTNPCLELSSPLLGRIIPSMVQNAFRIALDPIFPPPHQSCIPNMRKPVIPENLLQTNRFELVFDEVQQGKELKGILTNTPNIQIFDIEQEQEQQQNEEIEEKNLKLYEGHENEINLD